MFWFLMTQTSGGLNWENLMSLAPFELEVFYYMAVNDFKEKIRQQQTDNESMNRVVSLLHKAAEKR